MADTGWKIPGSDHDSGANQEFKNRSNARTDDANYASLDTSTSNNGSYWGTIAASVPGDATSVDGIEVRIRARDKYDSSPTCGLDVRLILNATGTPENGTTYSVPPSANTLPNSATSYTLGGASNLMGLITPTVTEINATDFYVHCIATASDSYQEDVGLELIEVKVHYTAAGGADHELTADDVSSASNVSSPAVVQKHVLTADDVDSASQVSTPTLNQVHAILADDVESASEVSNPAVTESHGLLANDVESASDVSVPGVGQLHVALAEDVESASEVSAPAVGQVHGLLAENVESASEVSTPTAVENSHTLLAENIESASEVSSPTLTESHVLLANNVESASNVTSPSLIEYSGDVGIPDSDVSAGSWLSTGASLYGVLDEETANDSDYIYTTALDTCEVGLTNPVDPVSSTGHVLKYRLYGDGSTDMTVSVRQGASTEIASWTETDMPAAWTDYQHTLNGTQTDNITDYTDLRVRFVAG